MYCEIQAALVDEWCDATLRFSAAIKAMIGSRTATMSLADYAILRAQADEYRLASENARLLLGQHRQEHGCWRFQGP
jgi:hypothetical protein